MARSSAISRIRWVMTIWNVLKIVKQATTRPMIANTIRNVEKKPIASATRSCVSSMIAEPDNASWPSGRIAARRVSELVLRDAGDGVDHDRVDLAGLADQQLLGGGEVEQRDAGAAG